MKALRWDWFKEDGCLHVPKEAMKMKRPLVIPVTQRMRAVLGVKQAGLVFPWMPAASSVWRDFKKYCRAAKIDPACSPNDLRRTWTHRMLAAGNSSPMVMRAGGWVNESVMLKHYFSEAQVGELRGAFERI